MKIRLHHSWRPGGRDIAGREILLHPGDYRVPHDISEDLAARAVKECGAERLEAPQPQPQPKAKGPAPENKAITPPPPSAADRGDDKPSRVGKPRRMAKG